MNEEIKALNHFEEAGFNSGQPKAMVVGIDGLLIKSMAAFREYFEHRFSAIDRRFDALERLLRSNHTRLNVLIGIQFAQAGLLAAVLAAVLLGGR